MKLKTIDTNYSREWYHWLEYGEPIQDVQGMSRIKRILNKLLPLTSIKDKTIELNIGSDPDDNAGSTPPATGVYGIIVTKGALDGETDAGLAETLGHELGHMALKTSDQFEADAYGVKLALDAGFDPKDMLKEVKHITPWTDDSGPERYKAMARIIKERLK